MSSRSAKARIQDILNAIDSIQRLQRRIADIDFEQFSQDETIAKAVLYDLIIIGEAAINVPADVQAISSELPWRLMSDMRNIMAHEYFQVNLRVTWSTIQNNLPPLIHPLQQLQANL
jgi:uncharacterized protein with HEPN domain